MLTWKHLFKIIIFCWCRLTALHCQQSCERTIDRYLAEGNQGEAGTFPWLGVLRVHFLFILSLVADTDEGSSLKIALTGIVLVKEKYAVANADDISRIPRHIFREDSKAMFVPTAQKPWYSRLKDYITHPEYEYSTINTIALVELAADEVPFKPICWPGYSFNTSNELYVMGFTDERQLLEKVLYKLQYVKAQLCSEFYERSGLQTTKSTPTYYVCGFASNSRNDCVWDNGMVLASNSSGAWVLIGLGVQGPGCAAPSRFINLFPYLPWIHSATSIESVYYYRRNNKKDFSYFFVLSIILPFGITLLIGS